MSIAESQQDCSSETDTTTGTENRVCGILTTQDHQQVGEIPLCVLYETWNALSVSAYNAFATGHHSLKTSERISMVYGH